MKLKTWKGNETGSALMISIIGVVLLALSVFTALHISSNLNADASRRKVEADAAGLKQTLVTILANQTLCTSGVDGTAGPQPGLQFEDDGGNVVPFDLTLIVRPQGQRVRIGTNLGNGNPMSGGGLKTIGSSAANQTILQYNMKINLIAAKMTAPPAVPNTYRGQIIARLESTLTSSNLRSLREIVISDMIFNIDGAGAITSCVVDNTAMTPLSMCSSMGCNYNSALEGQKCVCPLLPASCPAGQYIQGIDFSVDPPSVLCATVSLSCPTGQYLEAVSPSGTPYCASVISSTTCTYAGTSTTGTGGAASPAGCFCNTTGETWNGTACITTYTPPSGCGDWYFNSGSIVARVCASGVNAAMGGPACPPIYYSQSSYNGYLCDSDPVVWCVPCGAGSVTGVSCTLNTCESGGPPP